MHGLVSNIIRSIEIIHYTHTTERRNLFATNAGGLEERPTLVGAGPSREHSRVLENGVLQVTALPIAVAAARSNHAPLGLQLSE